MFEQKGWWFKRRLKHCGRGAIIYAKAELIKPQVIAIGAHTQIDDFVWILGGRGVTIGQYVHIASFVSVAGGGELVVEDYAGISAGCRLVTGTDDFLGAGLTGPTLPSEFRSVKRSSIILRRHALLGTGVIVHPDVEIGEGAVVGSGSLVLHDVPPWTVNVGSPCRVTKERPREVIVAFREELERKYRSSDRTFNRGEDQ